MFLFPKVLLAGGTFPPAAEAAIVALWLTTVLIMEATALPMGMTWSSWVEVLSSEPGSECSESARVVILALKELFFLWFWPVFDPWTTLRKQQAWWRHRRGWQRKQDDLAAWTVAEPMLSLSEELWSSWGDFTRRNLKNLRFNFLSFLIIELVFFLANMAFFIKSVN